MKRVYLFLVLFGVWCMTSSLWYMFSVKGLVSGQLHPADSGLAIAEILVMMLMAVLLGFAIAWYAREDFIARRQHDVRALLAERSALLHELQTVREQVMRAGQQLEHNRQTFQEAYQKVSRERDRIKEEVGEAVGEIKKLKAEIFQLQLHVQHEQQRASELAQALREEQQKEKENAGVRYFINPFQIAATLESNDIDDLKKIKGIGPVIERKLNMLGIVSYRQLSELNQEAIDQIAHTLKFFPDRIQRDKWVEQAREYVKNAIQRT
jgi:predicted flap endonuclease-1-like 5' DNA nuclease